jgi:hypothetical protein
MKRILAIVFMVAAATALYADEGKAEISRYQCTDLKGGKLWESTVTITPVLGEKDNYNLTEEGKGRYYGFDGITSRKSEMRYIENKEVLIPVSMKETVFSESGKTLLESTQKFYPDKKEVECEIKDPVKGREKKETLKYEGDIINGEIMDDYIERFLAAGEKKKVVYLLSDAELYRVTLRVVKKEEVTVNGKTREAYKIAIDPEIGILNPVKVFITKNYEWYSCEPPYEWLKFKGLESSMNSPVVEMTPLGD